MMENEKRKKEKGLTKNRFIKRDSGEKKIGNDPIEN